MVRNRGCGYEETKSTGTEFGRENNHFLFFCILLVRLGYRHNISDRLDIQRRGTDLGNDDRIFALLNLVRMISTLSSRSSSILNSRLSTLVGSSSCDRSGGSDGDDRRGFIVRRRFRDER